MKVPTAQLQATMGPVHTEHQSNTLGAERVARTAAHPPNNANAGAAGYATQQARPRTWYLVDPLQIISNRDSLS